MFSVVIPLYNKERDIKKTLESVIDQTYSDFEIIVVNDGSTDNSLEVALEINDPRIRVVDKPNGGVSSARNRGIEEARYEWIVFLDGDDLWLREHLNTVYQMILAYPDDKVFCTSFVRSNESMPSETNNSTLLIDDYFEEAIKDHFFWTSVVVIHKDVPKKVGLFREDICRGEDLDLWARIGRYYRIIKSNKITGIYVQESENKITKSKFDYRKSVFIDIHLRVKVFNHYTEKYYYQKLLTNGLKTFLVRADFRNALRTLYRLCIINFIKVNNETKG